MLRRGLTAEVMERAWRRVRRPGGAGVDGWTAERFAVGLEDRLARTHKALRNGQWRPRGLLRRQLPRPEGGFRRLGIPTLADRLAQAAVLEVVQPVLDRLLLPSVFGYRPARDRHGAIRHLCSTAGNLTGCAIIKSDLADLFGSLPHPRVLRSAHLALPDDRLWARLVGRWVSAWGDTPRRGVPQGAPLSPLLANLTLDVHLDRPLRASGRVRAWIRYGDDLVLVGRCGLRPELLAATLDHAARAAGLRLNPSKTRLLLPDHVALSSVVVLGVPLAVHRGPGGARLVSTARGPLVPETPLGMLLKERR